jgi:tRNA(fMet)-specific endonuclease VapC
MNASAPAGLVLLDTSILVHVLRASSLGHRVMREHQLAARSERPLISAVSAGELMAFAKRNHWGEAKQRKLRELLQQLVIVDVGAGALLERYADIEVHCAAQGRVLGDNDLWIAATASVTRALLLTTDKDFDPLDGVFLSRAWYDPASG